MPRLFTGIEIPPPLALMLSGLRGGFTGARWIDPENYHLTLRFIGDVDGRTADEVVEALARVSRPGFMLTIDGVGAFGGNRPHSLYASVAPVRALMELQAEQERLLQRIGLPPESRRYTPHVTIARLRGVSAGAVAQWLSVRGGFRAMPVPVERFVLFSSREGTGGGPYVVEQAYPLHQPAQIPLVDPAWPIEP